MCDEASDDVIATCRARALQMLSMATVDTIVTMDKHGAWLNFMRSKGYLQHVIGSLLQDDERLQHMLSPAPQPLRALYIFESKIVSHAV